MSLDGIHGHWCAARLVGDGQTESTLTINPASVSVAHDRSLLPGPADAGALQCGSSAHRLRGEALPVHILRRGLRDEHRYPPSTVCIA
jgi:hypothetical protein